MVRIYGITYGDKTTEFIPFKNLATEKLHRFEYNPMIEIVDNFIYDLKPYDYLAIFSWKITQKTGLTLARINDLIKHAPSAPVYNCSPFLGHNINGRGWFMNWSADGHGELLRELVKRCCAHVNIRYEDNPPVVIYANQFICYTWIYEQYMAKVVKPCLELLEGELWHLADQQANYSAGVAKSELKKHTGLDFYNYVPFVLERMFMQYVNHNNLKTISLI